ncbi:MAG: glutamine amidotransferase [Bacteroidetes bacterium QH_7_62_13]|nr:MAG: glutamine amidotransferase [Bacteroidetes bacterium QH_7_62_13]
MQAPDCSVPPLLRSPVTDDPPRLLLVQARSKPEMEHQEQTCFAERCRVPREQFEVVNVGRGDLPPTHNLDGVDAVLIGGAGQYSAAEDYPWTEPVLDLVRRAVDNEIPLFGSCWGHQVIARALGGRVVYDPDHSELGCGWVELTEAGQTDPLFHRFPRRFRANMGHHDRVVELPSGATELAHNAQRFQAFRLEQAPVYGTQFHSELNAERERERILVYKEQYRDALPDDGKVQRVLDSLADTTAVDDLLYDFLTTFVARGLPATPLTELVPVPPGAGRSLNLEDRSLTNRRLPES